MKDSILNRITDLEERRPPRPFKAFLYYEGDEAGFRRFAQDKRDEYPDYDQVASYDAWERGRVPTKPKILERIAVLEDRGRIQKREDPPLYDLSGLTEEQHEQLREGARMVEALRKRLIQVTDERLRFIRECERLLYSCPEVRR